MSASVPESEPTTHVGGIPFLSTPVHAHPERIGPYDIIQVLGEGGMGIVYEAEETGPVRRRVALKLVKGGLDSQDVLARFDAERRALAVMTHPCIARVLQAGSTPTGQPYFAMELVRGQLLTEFCDTRRLSVPQRLDVFIQVCDAVQHAHQKGVIHRDLKPSNILVTDEDGQMLPKIIDFGIAKALGPQTDATTRTMQGIALGTVAYMSPEQANSAKMDVDTRADIYSLGVLLYELLVGHLPIDPAELGVYAFMAKLIALETSPPTPSAGLTTVQREGDAIALRRRTDSKRLRRELRGDLDWIVMKAMHPDRQLRYETATSLAADLRRYLAREPINARPPSAAYRATKFIERHRVGVATAVMTLLAVVASAVVATVGFVRASQAEQRAAREATAATQVADFLVDLFRQSDPNEARRSSMTAIEILDRGTQRVQAELTAQPELQSRLLQTIGTVYTSVGRYDQSRQLLQDVLRIRQRDLGADHVLVGETLHALGEVERQRADHVSADSLLSRALVIRERAFGLEHVEVANTLALLAAVRWQQRREAEAESLYVRLIALNRKIRTPDDLRVTRDMRGLAAVYFNQKRYASAESLWLETLALQQRTLRADHPDIGRTLNNLGGAAYSVQRYPDARRYYERSRAILEPALGNAHPLLASTMNNLAEVHWRLKEYRPSDSLFARALAIKEATLAPENASIAVTLNGMAGSLRDQGRFAESEPLYRRALAIRERAAGAQSDVAETLRDYATLLRLAARDRDAAAIEARLRAMSAATDTVRP